jgi:hypothetical protein
MSLHPAQEHNIKQALDSKNIDNLNRALSKVLFTGTPYHEIEARAVELIAESPQDVREWWEEPCDHPTTIQEDALKMIEEEVERRGV